MVEINIGSVQCLESMYVDGPQHLVHNPVPFAPFVGVIDYDGGSCKPGGALEAIDNEAGVPGLLPATEASRSLIKNCAGCTAIGS